MRHCEQMRSNRAKGKVAARFHGNRSTLGPS
jgi:hypothetical protein